MRVDADHTTGVGRLVLDGDGTALALLSNANSYFSDERIAAIAEGCKKQHMNIVFVLPDGPEAANYRAFGYEQDQAAKKAKVAFDKISGKTKQQLRALNLLGEIPVYRWEDIRKHPAYIGMLGWIRTHYRNYQEFHDAVRANTKSVLASKDLRGKMQREMAPDERIDVAADFLLQEYAFLLAAGDILGIDRTASFYHRPMPVYEDLLKGKYGPIPTQKQLGIITAEVDEKTA